MVTHSSSSSRFPMTTGRLVKVITAGSFGIFFLVLPLQVFIVSQVLPPQVPWAVKAALLGVLSVIVLALGFTVVIAPKAVRVEGTRLVVERWLWSDFAVSLRQLTSARRGPPITLMMGDVRRVAGNGGLMGFTGLFHVRDVGLVRCWATKLGEPTVLVHRREGQPLLLGVDDSAGLLQALHRSGVSVS